MSFAFVALATDQHPVYQFFAPLTAAVWVRRVGWMPRMILVGSEASWRANPASACVLAELEDRLGIAPRYVTTPEGYRSANVAQIARMYAALDPKIGEDDKVVTSDIDMWPIATDWFRDHLPPAGMVTSYYANFPSRFPMCYVAASKATWHELHGYQLGFGVVAGGLTLAVDIHMLKHLKPETAPADAWQHDEEYLTARIHALGEHRQVRIRRPSGDPFPDRIDRVNWPREIDLAGKRDAHLLRPGHAATKWPQNRQLLGKLAPDLVAWADEYTAKYRALATEEKLPS